MVSDQAPTMVKAMSNAKILYPNLKHVTSLAHALHRVCEYILNKNNYADQFISCIKKY